MAVGLDTVVYSLLKKYTDNSIKGITGALAGKNCTIESVSKQDGLTTVTFKWTADDGTVRRNQIEIEDGTPIYTWTSGNHYEYGDLVIYASMFYRCITDNSDVEFDDTKWNELGSPDGNYDIVQNVADLPTRFTAADRKLYYVINDSDFYLWNGHAWVKVMSNSLEELEDVDLDNPAEGDVLTWDETAGGWVNGKGLLQYSTMPTASASLEGRVVQYVGETTADFINGEIYKCVLVDGSYIWLAIGDNPWVETTFTTISSEYVDKNGNIVDNQTSDYHRSAPIHVNANTKIKFHAGCYRDWISAISTCSEDGSIIESREIGVSETQDYYYVMNYDGYVMVSWKDHNGVTPSLYTYTLNQLEGIDNKITKTNISLINNDLYKIFRKVVCIGDSFTAGQMAKDDGTGGRLTLGEYSWVGYMGDTKHEWINLGWGGRTAKTWLQRDYYKAVEIGETQAYVIGFAISDSNTSDPNYLPVGEISDIGTDNDTYYAWMSKLIVELAEISPNAFIFVNTCPYPKYQIAPYNVAVCNIVDYYKDTYSVHCLDLVGEYGNLFNNKAFQAQFRSQHPTDLAYTKMANMYKFALNDYIERNYRSFIDVPWLDFKDDTSVFEQITELPTPSLTWLDKTYLLTSDQTGYFKGGIYQCVVNSGVYSWELIGFNPSSLGTAAFKNSTDRVAPNNTGLVESQSVYSAIQTALSSIYTPAGEITCAELTSSLLISDNVGKVYELSDSGTTTALFLQGAGKPLAIGDNVGIISAGPGRILFNLMANRIDLSTFQKKVLTSAVESQTTVEGALGALSTNKQAKSLTTSVEGATTVEGALGALSTNKVAKVTGKGLSTNDYDNTEKQKVTNAIQKSQTAGLVKNDGTVDTTAYAKQSEMSVTAGTGADADKTTIQLKTGTSATVLKTHQDISGKADKVSGATNGDIATLDANGNLVDSGKTISDVVPLIRIDTTSDSATHGYYKIFEGSTVTASTREVYITGTLHNDSSTPIESSHTQVDLSVRMNKDGASFNGFVSNLPSDFDIIAVGNGTNSYGIYIKAQGAWLKARLKVTANIVGSSSEIITNPTCVASISESVQTNYSDSWSKVTTESETFPKTYGASLDANNCTESGYYANVTFNVPVNGYGFSLFAELANSMTYCHQTAKQFIANDEPSVTYVRKGRYLNNAWVWTSWEKLVTESDLTYSTSETNTGKTWIDGNPIYRKTVATGQLPNNTIKQTALGVTNYDTIVSIYGIAYKSSNKADSIPLPYPYTNGPVMVYASGNASGLVVTVETVSNWTVMDASYVTVEYTKTTS